MVVSLEHWKENIFCACKPETKNIIVMVSKSFFIAKQLAVYYALKINKIFQTQSVPAKRLLTCGKY